MHSLHIGIRLSRQERKQFMLAIDSGSSSSRAHHATCTTSPQRRTAAALPKRKPVPRLLAGAWIGMGGWLAKACCGHEAPLSGSGPAAPVRRPYVANVCDAAIDAAFLHILRRRRQAPAQHRKFAAIIIAISCLADYWRHHVGEDRRHRRKVSCAVVHRACCGSDRRLAFKDAVEVAQFGWLMRWRPYDVTAFRGANSARQAALASLNFAYPISGLLGSPLTPLGRIGWFGA